MDDGSAMSNAPNIDAANATKSATKPKSTQRLPSSAPRSCPRRAAATPSAADMAVIPMP